MWTLLAVPLTLVFGEGCLSRIEPTKPGVTKHWCMICCPWLLNLHMTWKTCDYHRHGDRTSPRLTSLTVAFLPVLCYPSLAYGRSWMLAFIGLFNVVDVSWDVC
jgi:hypothetical protein